jgi:hypothetical protein
MKKFMKQMVLVITLMAITASCNKNDDSTAITSPSSRNIKYEVVGNFSGPNLTAAFTPATGGAVSEDINALPWSKEFTALSSVPAVALNITGVGGVTGQTLTLKIYAGGNVVRELTITADNSGVIAGAMNPYVF